LLPLGVFVAVSLLLDNSFSFGMEREIDVFNILALLFADDDAMVEFWERKSSLRVANVNSAWNDELLS